MSGSDEWHNAVSASSCVPDGYANVAYPEDWTQMNVLYTYTKQFGPLPKDPACLQPQMDLLVNDARINEAQDTKTCLADKRPFTVCVLTRVPFYLTLTRARLYSEDNTMRPAPEPTPTPTPEPVPEPTPTEAPAPPPTEPSKCNSAKFRRLRRAVKAAAKWAYVSIPYPG